MVAVSVLLAGACSDPADRARVDAALAEVESAPDLLVAAVADEGVTEAQARAVVEALPGVLDARVEGGSGDRDEAVAFARALFDEVDAQVLLDRLGAWIDGRVGAVRADVGAEAPGPYEREAATLGPELAVWAEGGEAADAEWDGRDLGRPTVCREPPTIARQSAIEAEEAAGRIEAGLSLDDRANALQRLSGGVDPYTALITECGRASGDDG